MNTQEKSNLNVKSLAEEHFVDAYANLEGCACADGHALHVALSEQRSDSISRIFTPEHKGIKNAYCAVHGRRCEV